MPVSEFTAEQREQLLRLADELGDAEVCNLWALPDATLRSWRRRAVDRRAQRLAPGADVPPAGPGFVEIDLPSRAGTVRIDHKAVARVVKGRLGGFHPAGRELELSPDTPKLADGEVIVLATETGPLSDAAQAARLGERYIVAREHDKVFVREGEIGHEEVLTDDGRRVRAKTFEDLPEAQRPLAFVSDAEKQRRDDVENAREQVRYMAPYAQALGPFFSTVQRLHDELSDLPPGVSLLDVLAQRVADKLGAAEDAA